MTATQRGVRVQRHPIRGGFYGLLLGISVAIYLVLFAVTPFRISTLVTIVVIGVVVGVLWGAFAPAKKGEGPNPNEHAFGSVFTSSADQGPPPTYEDTFGSKVQAADDGAFGAGAEADASGEDAAADGGGDADGD
ncbi:MAG: hypothetical protein AAF480_17295 [Actinomycetota bacterium]